MNKQSVYLEDDDESHWLIQQLHRVEGEEHCPNSESISNCNRSGRL